MPLDKLLSGSLAGGGRRHATSQVALHEVRDVMEKLHLLHLASLCLLPGHLVCPARTACESYSFGIAGNVRRVSEMNPDCAIRKSIAKSILVADFLYHAEVTTDPLDHIRGEMSIVKDFLNPTAMHIRQTSLQLLGDQMEEL